MYSAFWMMSRTGQSQPLGDQMASGPEFDILDYRGFDKTGPAGGGPDGLCDGSKDEFGNPFPGFFEFGDNP